MAEVVKGLGIGGQTLAERELGWNRRTIRKGMQELLSGQAIVDGYGRSGRKRIESRLPNLLSNLLEGYPRKAEQVGRNSGARSAPLFRLKLVPLLEDIRGIVDPQAQTDPSFKSTRLYTRISAAEIRHQLIAQKGCQDQELPSVEAIRCRLNEMGYTVKRVVKAKPQKRIPETEAIFEQRHQVNQQADDDPHTLRISIDVKVAVKLGEFDRGSVDTVLHFAETLKFKGIQPVVTLVEKVYETRVKLTKQAMAELEQQIHRLPNLPKWFVEITGKPT